MFVYVSSLALFTGKKGLSLFNLDTSTGKLTFLSRESELSYDVSYFDSNRKILYACNAVADHLGMAGGGGAIVSFAVDTESGKLNYISESPSYGANPCNLSMDEKGEYLLVVNHTSMAAATKVKRDCEGKYHIFTEKDDPTLVLFPVNDRGEIGDPTDIIIESNITTKYIASRPHSVTWSPDKKYFAVCDNGADKITMYSIDHDKKCMRVIAGPYSDAPFSTVRYCLFHPTLPFFYTNHEWGSLNVRGYKIDANGGLTDIETISSVEDGYEKKQGDEGQGFMIHPNGKYIYNLLAGRQEIVVFMIDQETGALTRIQNYDVGGKWLRCGAITPDGKYILVGNMVSGEVLVLSLGEDGKVLDCISKCEMPGAAWITLA